mmetsp:Transcript_11037/g.15296  ORF Transcript_11037/g.15296 Transcript_11037/m.15296 type:complete len:81 (+) Transcript_11037:72-314(+)
MHAPYDIFKRQSYRLMTGKLEAYDSVLQYGNLTYAKFSSFSPPSWFFAERSPHNRILAAPSKFYDFRFLSRDDHRSPVLV